MTIPIDLISLIIGAFAGAAINSMIHNPDKWFGDDTEDDSDWDQGYQQGIQDGTSRH